MIQAEPAPGSVPIECSVCGQPVLLEAQRGAGDATCPSCGVLLWFPAPRKTDDGALDLASLDFLPQAAIVRLLEQKTKRAAIEALVNRLVAIGAVPADVEQELVAAVLEREEMGSTGIGGHVAVPHAQHSAVPGLICALGSSRAGIPFDSLDGRPVNTIFLVLYPPDRSQDHLRALERISRFMRAMG